MLDLSLNFRYVYCPMEFSPCLLAKPTIAVLVFFSFLESFPSNIGKFLRNICAFTYLLIERLIEQNIY